MNGYVAGLSRRTGHLLGAAGLFVLVWSILASTSALPHLDAVAEGVVWMAVQGQYFHDTLISVLRFAGGYAIGASLAIPMALLTGRGGRILAPMIELNLQAQRAVPVIALVPLAVFLWGLGEQSKLFIVAWGTFFPIWIATHNGARSLNPNYLNAARSLGARGIRLWTQVIVPHLSESILSGCRVAIGVGLISLVAAELTGGFEFGFFSGGLGFRIQRWADLGRLDLLVGCIFTFGVLGWIFDRMFLVVVRPFVIALVKFDPYRSTLRVGRTATR